MSITPNGIRVFGVHFGGGSPSFRSRSALDIHADSPDNLAAPPLLVHKKWGQKQQNRLPLYEEAHFLLFIDYRLQPIAYSQ